jgi:DNA mismatch repair ATPase MutS
MQEFIGPLREAAGQAARIARNVSMLLPEGSSTGDLAAMALEYVSIYFLHEVRTFHQVMTDVATRRDALETMFTRLGELDAWQSVASFRAGLEGFCEPVFTEEGPRLNVQDVKHPLLEHPVGNSIEIESRGVAITGSNMSGKTTFLRTLGVNVLLAQTIYTCRAAMYRGRFMKVMASMDESDDLLEQKSYYLAEAARLLKIVKESDRAGLVLALIDEPLAGTNSPQRLAASREILHYLVDHNALAMVCTHDVELVSQLQARGDFEAFHFSGLADETGIRFDYLLRRGLDYHGNAIRVLKYLGYPEEILAGAMVDFERGQKVGQE